MSRKETLMEVRINNLCMSEVSRHTKNIVGLYELSRISHKGVQSIKANAYLLLKYAIPEPDY